MKKQKKKKLMRMRIKDPLTQKEYEGIGFYNTESSASDRKWVIFLDNGERLSLTGKEAILYKLEVL